MGTDINAAFGHKTPFPPTESLVQSMCQGLKPAGMAGSGWYQPPQDKKLISGYEMIIHFGPRSSLITTGYGWGPPSAIRERERVISSCREIARFFRSPLVIFLPDDIEPYVYAGCWIDDGLAIEEVQEKLAHVREPSPDFRAAIRQRPDCYEVDGYVIEQLDYNSC